MWGVQLSVWVPWSQISLHLPTTDIVVPLHLSFCSTLAIYHVAETVKVYQSNKARHLHSDRSRNAWVKRNSNSKKLTVMHRRSVNMLCYQCLRKTVAELWGDLVKVWLWVRRYMQWWCRVLVGFAVLSCSLTLPTIVSWGICNNTALANFYDSCW